MLSFPEGFVWGTATAAHQIEGGCWNNDWWAWEHDPGSPCVEPSGDACDSWHRWPEDLDICRHLGLGSYRFSLEWSRIEPEPGEWSTVAMDHYRRVSDGCRERGLHPVVTFHHFTTPRWVAEAGGWEAEDTAGRFASFCERAAAALSDSMGTACTINEPNIVATMGYLVGVFPPGRSDSAVRRHVNDVFIAAHHQAAAAIRAAAPGVPVGLTLSMTDYQADGQSGSEARRDRIRRNMEDVYLEAAAQDDFIGVQTYTRTLVGPDGSLPPPEGARRTTMGYEWFPDALEACIRRAWDLTGGVPVLVTENGVASTAEDDTDRIEFVAAALAGVRRCLDDGIEVRGYTYWSLLDNFEWAYGYTQRFGLVAVDRTSFERRPKPSAAWFGQVARTNQLSPS